MAKIAVIGAGSVVFCKTLLNDMFATPALTGSTYALMGPTMWKLEKMKTYAQQVIDKNKIEANIYCTTDRRDALKDADYVILMFQIGGVEAFGIDYEIPIPNAHFLSRWEACRFPDIPCRSLTIERLFRP